MTDFRDSSVGFMRPRHPCTARHSRTGHSARPTLVSTACTCANTKTPVVCTSGSGMLSARAVRRMARLSSQGIAVAAEGDLVCRDVVFIGRSPVLAREMTRPDTQFDYLARNGMADIRVIGFPP
jgi:hypothetical protein